MAFECIDRACSGPHCLYGEFDSVRVLFNCGLVDGFHVETTKRLTVSMVDTFIADLKDAVKEVKVLPSRNGTMVSLYGMFLVITLPIIVTDEHICFPISLNVDTLGLGKSSAVGPSMVGQLAEAFLDTMYKA